MNVEEQALYYSGGQRKSGKPKKSLGNEVEVVGLLWASGAKRGARRP